MRGSGCWRQSALGGAPAPASCLALRRRGAAFRARRRPAAPASGAGPMAARPPAPPGGRGNGCSAAAAEVELCAHAFAWAARGPRRASCCAPFPRALGGMADRFAAACIELDALPRAEEWRDVCVGSAAGNAREALAEFIHTGAARMRACHMATEPSALPDWLRRQCAAAGGGVDGTWPCAVMCVDLDAGGRSARSSAFAAAAVRNGTRRLYHGTAAERLHSIFRCGGLISASGRENLERNGSVFGDGIYLAEHLTTALSFATPAAVDGWSAAATLPRRAAPVLVVELVRDGADRVENGYHVVSNADLCRVTHVLLFDTGSGGCTRKAESAHRAALSSEGAQQVGYGERAVIALRTLFARSGLSPSAAVVLLYACLLLVSRLGR